MRAPSMKHAPKTDSVKYVLQNLTGPSSTILARRSLEKHNEANREHHVHMMPFVTVSKNRLRELALCQRPEESLP